MKWKVIGQSVIGSSHLQSGKLCEDAIAYRVVSNGKQEEVLVCCVSDGAGSAVYAAEASALATTLAAEKLAALVTTDSVIDEGAVTAVLEDIYEALYRRSVEKGVDISEYSCTFLACIIQEATAVFLQVGDGAIVRDDTTNSYTVVWWPDNGEYSNTTSFLADDVNLSSLKKVVIHEQIHEVALFTDGLQLLALNYETSGVHQPFFADLFKWLRLASRPEEVMVLDKKLGEYLAGDRINARTDDDKTLFLATRKSND